MHSTTYYRMDPRALEIGESGDSTVSEAGKGSRSDELGDGATVMRLVLTL